jgi:hypothetical protein
MRLSFHNIIFDVSTEFMAEHISPLFPKRFATRRAYQVHNNKLPTAGAANALNSASLITRHTPLLGPWSIGWDKGNSVIETHEHIRDFKEPWRDFIGGSACGSAVLLIV